jgi:hypothetical protein
LHLAISQVKPADVPTILINLTNTNTEVPYTVLTWNSPLDDLLVQLGLASLIAPGSSTPIDIPTIMVKRLVPPPPGNLVTLEPGKEVSKIVEIGERFATAEQLRGDGSGGPVKVQLNGEWTAVWPGLRTDDLIGTEKLVTLGYGEDEEGVLRGEYMSEILEMDV